MPKTKCLQKSEVKFIQHRLQELDLEIMEAFVVKEVEAVQLNIACYPNRQALWSHLKCSKKGKWWKFLKSTSLVFLPHGTREQCSSLCSYVNTKLQWIVESTDLWFNGAVYVLKCPCIRCLQSKLPAFQLTLLLHIRMVITLLLAKGCACIHFTLHDAPGKQPKIIALIITWLA